MRLIDADELIRDLKQVTVTQGITSETVFKQVLTDIENQPTVNRWIPCSERLPKIMQNVIVQTTDNSIYVVNYYGESDCWGGNSISRGMNLHPRVVLAWMPLPELYPSPFSGMYIGRSRN